MFSEEVKLNQVLKYAQGEEKGMRKMAGEVLGAVGWSGWEGGISGNWGK